MVLMLTPISFAAAVPLIIPKEESSSKILLPSISNPSIIDSSRFYSLIQTDDDGYVLAGETYPYGLLVKTDANGIEEWNHTYYDGTDNESYGSSVIQTSDGGYALTGHFYQVNKQSFGYLIKIDQDGNTEWNQ